MDLSEPFRVKVLALKLKLERVKLRKVKEKARIIAPYGVHIIVLCRIGHFNSAAFKVIGFGFSYVDEALNIEGFFAVQAIVASGADTHLVVHHLGLKFKIKKLFCAFFYNLELSVRFLVYSKRLFLLSPFEEEV